MKLKVWLRPVVFIAILLIAWQIAVNRSPVHLLPGPWAVAGGIVDLLHHGLLLKYVVASLFRVTWGFVLAAVLAIPLGLTIGWYRRAEMAVNPLLQIFRPISPLAWIPLAILWFGVGDAAAVFLIFLGCFFPLLLTAINAVQQYSFGIYQRGAELRFAAGRSGLSGVVSGGDAATVDRIADHARDSVAGRGGGGDDSG